MQNVDTERRNVLVREFPAIGLVQLSQRAPKNGAILTIIGAGFIVGVDAFIELPDPGSTLADYLSPLGIFLDIDLVLAVLVLLMGVLMFTSPERKTIWAIIAITFAFPSLPFAFSGFVVGIVLVVVGGVVAIRYRVPATSPVPPPTPPEGGPPTS